MASRSGVRSGSVNTSRRGAPFRVAAGRFKSPAVRRQAQNPPELAAPSANSAEASPEVVARTGRAAQACGRDPATVALVAVSKQQPWEAIVPVLAAGQTVFGENRVQEAMARWEGK